MALSPTCCCLGSTRVSGGKLGGRGGEGGGTAGGGGGHTGGGSLGEGGGDAGGDGGSGATTGAAGGLGGGAGGAVTSTEATKVRLIVALVGPLPVYVVTHPCSANAAEEEVPAYRATKLPVSVNPRGSASMLGSTLEKMPLPERERTALKAVGRSEKDAGCSGGRIGVEAAGAPPGPVTEVVAPLRTTAMAPPRTPIVTSFTNSSMVSTCMPCRSTTPSSDGLGCSVIVPFTLPLSQLLNPQTTAHISRVDASPILSPYVRIPESGCEGGTGGGGGCTGGGGNNGGRGGGEGGGEDGIGGEGGAGVAGGMSGGAGGGDGRGLVT
jgi:hypothetical protein